MEIKKTLQGGFAILFTKEEFTQLTELKHDGKFGTFEKEKPVKKIDPTARLYKPTRELIIELKEIYGNGWIDRKGKIVKELERKYYVRSLTDTLKELELKGFCELKREQSNSNHRAFIKVFKFNW